MMVMDYIRGGNLRQHLKNNDKKLDLKKKLIQLVSIAWGLKHIHQQGLVHKDFHSGNILSSGKETFFSDLPCWITDLGLCKPANKVSQENIYGILPYVAPEILSKKEEEPAPYTSASDIYSFGIVMYEVLSGLPPYYDREQSISLGVQICQGLRPQSRIKIPQLLEKLINRC